jgi:hypothetical protein
LTTQPTQSSTVRCMCVHPGDKTLVVGDHDGSRTYFNPHFCAPFFNRIPCLTGAVTVFDIEAYGLGSTSLQTPVETAAPPRIARWEAHVGEIYDIAAVTMNSTE